MNFSHRCILSIILTVFATAVAAPSAAEAGTKPFVGEIMLFAGRPGPRLDEHWASCDGTEKRSINNRSLAWLSGLGYETDSKFALPDFRDAEKRLRKFLGTHDKPKYLIALDGAYPTGGVGKEMLGSIRLIATREGQRLPWGWALCEGQTLPVRGNERLFKITGNRFGGDGKTNFALPDLRAADPLSRGGKAEQSEKALPSPRLRYMIAIDGYDPSKPPTAANNRDAVPYIGEVILFAGDIAPKYCFPCDGRRLQIRSYVDLFEIVGADYWKQGEGEGRTKFTLPDLSKVSAALQTAAKSESGLIYMIRSHGLKENCSRHPWY
jgi:microcystin-dependent protein